MGYTGLKCKFPLMLYLISTQQYSMNLGVIRSKYVPWVTLDNFKLLKFQFLQLFNNNTCSLKIL